MISFVAAMNYEACFSVADSQAPKRWISLSIEVKAGESRSERREERHEHLKVFFIFGRSKGLCHIVTKHPSCMNCLYGVDGCLLPDEIKHLLNAL
jgi:hypothetical protein